MFLKGYPRLSETFIAQEILSLQRAGLRMDLVSLRHPTDTKNHPVHDEIVAPLTYLPEYVHQEPRRCLTAFLAARKLPGFREAFRTWRVDFARDRTRNRFRRFVQAMVAATELPSDIEMLYGHFIHTPGSVTRYTGIMRELPFAISAHAKDIWTSPDWELSEKLDSAEWTVTCTKGGADHLSRLSRDPNKVRLLYHGLDLNRFPPPHQAGSQRDGRQPDNPVQLLSVGRAVEKKGLDTLLRALSRLPKSFHWRWTHIAGGPQLNALKALAEDLSLSKKISFLGAQDQSRVLQAYRESDLFVLPCRIAANGDRDGLPNVIVEAQSQRLPVISTPISGIPELIVDGRNGRLVPPDDSVTLARAIVELGRDPELRAEMGKVGMGWVHDDFNAGREIQQLIDLLG